MTATLKGSLVGKSRLEMVSTAIQRAEKYFGTNCVGVVLENERTHAMLVDTFLADFTAREQHTIEIRSYGPDRCRKCGRDSWPQQPLPGVLA